MWDPVSLTILMGDYVRWTWSSTVTGIGYSIQQTETPGAVVGKEGGFTSGAKTPKGM
jgi:hypothetical protein